MSPVPRVQRPAASGGYALLPVILRYRWRMMVNGVLRAGRGRRAWAALLALTLAGGVNLSYSFAGDVFTLATPTAANLRLLVAGGLALLCGFTALSSVTFALSSLFFAKDLDGLLSSPVPPRTVVLSRMLTQMCLGVGLGAILVGPPLLAYMVAVGRPWAFPLVAAVIVALSAIPLALATALVIAVVRLIPARYVRGAGAVVITVAVFAITGVNLLLRGGDAFTIHSAGSLNVAQFGGAAMAPWQPIGWGARSVIAFIAGDAGLGAVWAIPVAITAVILLFAVAGFGEAAFVDGFQRSAGAAPRRRRDRPSGRGVSAGARARPIWLLLAAKDAREVRRDVAQLTQLILPLVIFALYIGSPGHSPGELSTTALPSWYGTALTAAFASLFSASGIPLRAVGSEGARLWVLRSAPISPRTVLMGKYALGFVVAFGLGGLLLGIGEWRSGLDPWEALTAMVRFAVIIAGLVGLAIGLGAMRPRLDWTDPRRAIGIGASFAFLGLGATYLTVCFTCVALPYAVAPGNSLAIAVADLGVLTVAAVTGFGALFAGSRRLAVLET